MRIKGFGKVAFGVRCFSGADPVFLKSWTKLINQAYRKGDSCLSPAAELPHHWAANVLVKSFLDNTECDTLMLIDDDMVFDPELVNNLRDHKENFKYGMVQGMCCSRRSVNGPLILGEAEGGFYTPIIPDESDKTIEVGMVGLAFTLIRREVFNQVKKVKPDNEMFFSWRPNGCGEDAHFCKYARKAGVLIGVDTEVSVGHRIKIEVSWDKKRGKCIYHTYQNRPFLELLQDVQDNENKGD